MLQAGDELCDRQLENLFAVVDQRERGQPQVQAQLVGHILTIELQQVQINLSLLGNIIAYLFLIVCIRGFVHNSRKTLKQCQF